jgi:hypothetical protein
MTSEGIKKAAIPSKSNNIKKQGKKDHNNSVYLDLVKKSGDDQKTDYSLKSTTKHASSDPNLSNHGSVASN